MKNIDTKSALLTILRESSDLSRFSNIEEVRFKEDLRLDSLDTVELIIALEKELGIDIDENHLVGVKTVGQLLTVVNGAGNDKESLLSPSHLNL